ncbi:DUF3611 family protein [Crocosphaera sp.]|uniref:DUF3611 family protein n=1 Tax=Crocosphaera sp. TaxID=2729996 RepID=UPI0026180925|nr:DUF3611 family protein [Crocosphaera sp.]MDJ0580769.1 DUF3611 family protein [Crocosphaera sp.]
MFKLLSRTPPTHLQIAANLRRLGWIGFWCQLILGSIPVVLLTFQWIFSKEQTMAGIDITNIFSFIDIMTLLFTIFWCLGYTQLGKKLEKGEKHPKKAKIIRTIWIGITANLGVILLAVLIGIITLGRLLYIILSLPQGATTILQPVPGGTMVNPGLVIVPMDILGLLAIMNVILAGLVGVTISLWLLFRIHIWQP